MSRMSTVYSVCYFLSKSIFSQSSHKKFAKIAKLAEFFLSVLATENCQETLSWRNILWVFLAKVAIENRQIRQSAEFSKLKKSMVEV